MRRRQDHEGLANVCIVGMGPAGLSVGAECVYHGVEGVLALEKGDAPNQTVHRYYPDDKRVDAAYKGQEVICAGVLCFRDTTKANFLAVAGQMLRRFPFPVICGAAVDSIRRDGDGTFTVSTTGGFQHRARFVVIAIGRMGRPNKPDYYDRIPAAARTRVHFDLHGLLAEGQEILVAGGGNAAAEYALSLAPKARVTLSYRGAEFSRLNPMNRALLDGDERGGRLIVLRRSDVIGIDEHGGRLEIRFASHPMRIVDHVVFGIGGSAPAAFLKSAGVLLDERGTPRLDAESTAAKSPASGRRLGASRHSIPA